MVPDGPSLKALDWTLQMSGRIMIIMIMVWQFNVYEDIYIYVYEDDDGHQKVVMTLMAMLVLITMRRLYLNRAHHVRIQSNYGTRFTSPKALDDQVMERYHYLVTVTHFQSDEQVIKTITFWWNWLTFNPSWKRRNWGKWSDSELSLGFLHLEARWKKREGRHS